MTLNWFSNACFSLAFLLLGSVCSGPLSNSLSDILISLLWLSFKSLYILDTDPPHINSQLILSPILYIASSSSCNDHFFWCTESFQFDGVPCMCVFLLLLLVVWGWSWELRCLNQCEEVFSCALLEGFSLSTSLAYSELTFMCSVGTHFPALPYSGASALFNKDNLFLCCIFLPPLLKINDHIDLCLGSILSLFGL